MMSKKKKTENILEEENLADLHHDLKNQIASLKAFNQLIKREAEDEKVLDYSDSIEERIEEILKLLDNFFNALRDS